MYVIACAYACVSVCQQCEYSRIACAYACVSVCQQCEYSSCSSPFYVIVIVRLVCDMAQTQHEARGREAPEGECCV